MSITKTQHHIYLNSNVFGLTENGFTVKHTVDAYLKAKDHEFLTGEFPYNLILRRLSSITTDEWLEVGKIHVTCGGKISISVSQNTVEPNGAYFPEVFIWLIEKGFWLWNDKAFDDMIILDAATVK